MTGDREFVRIATIITTMQNTENLLVRDIPVTSTIIEFDDETLGIVDTGMVDNPEFLEKLDNLGCQPSDFNLVFNTHLHTDHIGNNRLFMNARIVISRKELAYHRTPKDTCNTLVPNPGVPENMLTRQLQEMRERYPVFNLIGESGQIQFLEDNPRLPINIKLIPVSGHSIDDHAVFIQGKNRNVLATGDALYHHDLWRGPTISGIHLNEELFRLHALYLSEFQGIIVPGHDLAFDSTTNAYLETDIFITI